MHHRPRLQSTEIQHGGDKNTASTDGDGNCRAMNALIKIWQTQQSQSANQHDQTAQYQQHYHGYRSPQRQGFQVDNHSIISPRIRNFAKAMDDTKPVSAISIASSK